MILRSRACAAMTAALVLLAISPAGAEPPPGHGKPDPCDKKKPKPECPPPELPRPYITTVAGGGYTDGRPATEANIATPSDVAIDPAGNVYVSDRSEARIRKIDTSGIISTFAGNGIRGYRGDGGPATKARLADPGQLAFGPDGALYHHDGRYNVIRKVDANGVISTVAGGPDAPISTGGIAFGPDGLLYFSQGHSIRRVEQDGTITTVAGIDVPGFSGDGGPATAAQLNFPGEIAFGPAGELYVADTSNRRVRVIGTDGVISTFAGNGEYASAGDGGPAEAASFMTPTHVSVDGAGNVYVSDGRSEKVRRIDTAGTVTTFAGSGETGFSGDGGLAPQAQLNAPFGTASAPDGTVYLADGGNARVRRISPDGTISTFAGNGQEWHLGDGEDATAAALRLAGGTALGPDGTLYVADTGHQRVRAVDPVTNVITTVAGTGKLGFSGDGGPATAARLGDPWDVDVDEAGNLYVADYWNNRIRKVSAGGTITTVAGNGTTAHSGDGGPAVAAGMDHPTAVDYYDGELFIAVGGSRAIRRVGRDGRITTIAGKGYLPPDDGVPAALVSLKGPTDVVAMPDGSVLFADAFDHRVWRVDPAAAIPRLDLVAGTGVAGSTGDGGPATEATFSYPWGILPLPDGSLLVTDHNNHRIRRIGPDGVVRAYAGDGRDEMEGDGGHPLAASFRGPTNLTSSPGGVLVTDSANGRIRLIRE